MYVGWTAYTSVSLLEIPPASTAWTWLVYAFAPLTSLGSAMAFWVQGSPRAFYLYVAFPCHFWSEFFLRGAPAIVKVISQLSFSPRQFCIYALLVVASLQGMVVRASLHPEAHGLKIFLQAAYTYRWIWSAGLFIFGVLWLHCTWPSSTLSWNWNLALQ